MSYNYDNDNFEVNVLFDSKGISKQLLFIIKYLMSKNKTFIIIIFSFLIFFE